MANEDILSDIDLDSFDFDDLSFEKEADTSANEPLSLDNEDAKESADDLDPIVAAFNDMENEDVLESVKDNDIFATEELSAEPKMTEEPAEFETVEETPHFKESFSMEEFPTEPEATKESVESQVLKETPQFDESYAIADEPSEQKIMEDSSFEDAFKASDEQVESEIAATEDILEEPEVSPSPMETELDEVTPQFENDFAEEEVSVVPDLPEETTEVDVVEEEEPQFEETFDKENILDTQHGMSVNNVELSNNVGYLRWYSGRSDEEMFEIDRNFMSGHFDADEHRKAIHVNVGYDTYGWNVQFFDGVNMNLRDVKEYQIRNGKLPYPDGRIVHGKQILEFTSVERIVVYESVKYFSYGI